MHLINTPAVVNRVQQTLKSSGKTSQSYQKAKEHMRNRHLAQDALSIHQSTLDRPKRQ
jgi:hypothetical protein